MVAATQSNRILCLRALIPPKGWSCSLASIPGITAKPALQKAATINVVQVAAQQTRGLTVSRNFAPFDHSATVCGSKRPPTAFVALDRACNKYQRRIHEQTFVRLYLNRPKWTASTIMAENNIDHQLLLARIISSILPNSVQNVDGSNKICDLQQLIQEATQLLHNLQSRANSLCVKETITINDVDPKCNEDSNSRNCAPLQILSGNAIAAVDALRLLVHRVNQSPRKGKKSRKGSKQSSGRAWSALESVVTASLNALDAYGHKNDIETSKLSITLAVLSLGLALAINSADPVITKMFASAVLPSDEIHHGKSDQKFVGSMIDPARILVHSMARSAILELLRLAGDNSIRSPDSKNVTVDMQIVAKLENGYCVGSFGRSMSDETVDAELSNAVADIVNNILKLGKNGGDAYSHGDGDESIISKDVFVPALSIIANVRPWTYVDAEKLARIAAEMDLWYSVEILCDAIIGTGEAMDTKCGEATIESSVPSLPHFSAAQRTAQAIVDIAFDHRLYRRADTLVTKYYPYVGPERYAEARFLHACDTIEKVIKKRQVQIIEKQVERVDEVVVKVSRDLTSVGNLKTARFEGEDIEIQTMSDHIREFSLRRLRASSMHTTAARLANLWGKKYSQDPMHLMQELAKRRSLYLQWNDDCCPGSGTNNYKSGALPLPQLITTPTDLLYQFAILNKTGTVIGFDCEWHDSINYVALLQLSTTTNALLLDIPALTKTNEGCDALRRTVGELFSRSNGRPVIGFSCKDDIKRLRASPCVPASTHWFPLKDRELSVRDLRHLVAEMSPGQGLQNYGLSRLCEVFLGKQLDKAEQCSDWLMRPLSPEQIEYAALDAWACAAIHSKIQIGSTLADS